ncbi:hypothetical protein [Defluviimonas salinarum]|uniref:Uncharacterized protein n=1 Tax=Defluviimonas salinarum TaxID=2992147 RepID=A0ABT3J5E4_9RHOB|nr:hypothetical protein [Defluviimonas salinarum]MCW3782914.1 hypothetical protein [Defluviimonas salinarum]
MKHGPGEHRIEDLAANCPEVSGNISKLASSFLAEKGLSDEFERNLSKLALRLISAKGLSDEFADLLETIEANAGNAPAP